MEEESEGRGIERWRERDGKHGHILLTDGQTERHEVRKKKKMEMRNRKAKLKDGQMKDKR